ncbi:MAG TPA: hypothetical protein VFJ56_07265, partial [Nitrospira sp.]|nr:hypothetical protein [Nitrospira sp.]
MIRRRPSILLIMLVAGLFASSGIAYGQGRHGDVMVTVANDKVIALPAGGSAIEEGLGANETVQKTAARGQTGFALTSTRLLGFTSELRRWAEIPLTGEERVERHQVLPRLIVVQTNRQLYGFQEGRGHWTNESLGASEAVTQVHGHGHVAVVITTERALAFSSFTGGFFSLPWSTDERVLSVEETNDAVMVRTSTRLLA